MNRTKRSLLICAVSLLLFVSLVITCFAVAASISSVWQGGVSSVLEGTGTEADPYRISRGDDLALFAQMVAGGETFEGKHVVLCSDIDMGGSDVTDSDGKLMLYPIGFDADSSYIKGKHGVFSGIFDGRGHTISNIYQNVEQLRGVYNETQYNAAMGLFGHVEDATIKNLFLAGFTIGGADTDVGCVAAYASGECRFENISLVGCSAYTGDGSAAGIVGFDAAAQKGSASSFTFRNITIDASNSIGAVDGSWDVHVGGLVGYLSADSSVLMDNCHTAQKLGVNVSADGEYVGAGMLVGSVDKRNGTVLDTSLITAQDSSVYFIDATPTDQLLSGYGFGITPVRAGELDGVVTGTGTPYFYDKFVGQDREAVTNTTLTLGELFSSDVSAFAVNSDDVQIYVESISGNAAVAYEQNTDDWSATTLSVTGLGSLKVTICDYYFCKTESAVLSVVEPTPTEKFTLKFPNTDTYLYRVGNGNAVTLGTLFGTVDGAAIDSQAVTVEITKKNASMNVAGTLTANSTDWTKSTIQFAGTGVVTLTVTDNDYCIPRELTVEIVDGKNVTSAAGSLDGTDVVLLSDVKVSSGGNINYRSCTVYGNGFTIDVRGGMNEYNSKQGHGIIIIKDVTLDNLVIVGDVYTSYGAYSTQADYTAAIDATSSTIQNCYIANCSAPIRANGVTLKNTTLYGGTVANIILSGSTNVFDDVTTVNYNDGRGILGLGILISDGASDTTKLVLEGELKQYNFICQDDVSVVPGNYAPTIFNQMFDSEYSAYHITNNGKTYVNTGIISMNPDFNSVDITDNASTGYLANDNVVITLKDPTTLMSTKVTGAFYTSPSSTVVDNAYDMTIDAHRATVQGDYLPTPEFDLGDQAVSKDGDDDTRYLVGDINGIEAMYQSGDDPLSLDLTSLMKVYKYSGIYYVVSAQCKDPSGNVLSAVDGVVTLSESGIYTLVFTVVDNVFYDANGETLEKSVTRTYEVSLDLAVKEASIPDATITVSTSNITGSYTSSGTDYKYKFYPLQAITSITDAGASFNFKANIASMSISYASTDNAFGGVTTITVTYTTGQVLTVTLGKPTDLNSPSASNGGKTLSVAADSTNGIVVTSDGKIASGSAKTANWPITGWSFKGINQQTVTNSTAVKIAFTKPSTCVTPDTLVTLADGTQKRVDSLTGEELLLVWNHQSGRLEAVNIAYIVNHDKQTAEHEVIRLYFSDGKSIKIIGEHVFYDATLMRYVSLDSDAEQFIGHSFLVLAENGTALDTAQLVKVEKSTVLTEAYEVVSYQHLTCFTDGILSTSAYLDKLLNIFDVNDSTYAYSSEKIAEDIEKYGLYTYADFEDIITEEAFELYNAAYLKIAVGKGYISWDDILDLVEIYFDCDVTPIQ